MLCRSVRCWHCLHRLLYASYVLLQLLLPVSIYFSYHFGMSSRMYVFLSLKSCTLRYCSTVMASVLTCLMFLVICCPVLVTCICIICHCGYDDLCQLLFHWSMVHHLLSFSLARYSWPYTNRNRIWVYHCSYHHCFVFPVMHHSDHNHSQG